VVQLALFGNDNGSRLVSVQNGEYRYLPEFFSRSESDRYFQKLQNDILWKQESLNMYGKRLPFPRLTAWYGDKGKSYAFSGVALRPHAWTGELLEIKNKIEPIAGTRFNSVLLNRYRNGKDSISWHTDAEPEMGVNPIIGSVNFGATRKFQLRHVQTREKIEIELRHGSLLIMQGEMQHFWRHQVPKTKQKVNERINLTFRAIQ